VTEATSSETRAPKSPGENGHGTLPVAAQRQFVGVVFDSVRQER
jgi:hypothetical protein